MKCCSLVYLALLCSSSLTFAQTERPIEATLCQLKASPEAFDKKIIRLTAFHARGFEHSSLEDPRCLDEAYVNWDPDMEMVWVWVTDANEIHRRDLKGYRRWVDSKLTRQFRALVQKRANTGQLTKGTFVGTFYAGKQIEINGKRTGLRGFGHMGCCSLFVLSEVESFETEYDSELDYGGGRGFGVPNGCQAAEMLKVPKNAQLREWQKESARNGGWRKDAQKVAEEQLARMKSVTGDRGTRPRAEVLVPGTDDLKARNDHRPTETLLEVVSKQAYIRHFEWIEADRGTRYLITLSRPYWLLSEAESPSEVIWVPVQATLVDCRPHKRR